MSAGGLQVPGLQLGARGSRSIRWEGRRLMEAQEVGGVRTDKIQAGRPGNMAWGGCFQSVVGR